jgi:hypothetical protein
MYIVALHFSYYFTAKEAMFSSSKKAMPMNEIDTPEAPNHSPKLDSTSFSRTPSMSSQKENRARSVEPKPFRLDSFPKIFQAGDAAQKLTSLYEAFNANKSTLLVSLISNCSILIFLTTSM